MLKQFYVYLAGTGFTALMLIFGIVAYYRPPVGTFQWPMMVAVWMMAVGLLGINISLNRIRRAQAMTGSNPQERKEK